MPPDEINRLILEAIPQQFFVLLFCVGEIHASSVQWIPKRPARAGFFSVVHTPPINLFLVFMFYFDGKVVGVMFGAQNFFGQVWGNSGKIASLPQNLACSLLHYTYALNQLFFVSTFACVYHCIH